MFGGVLRKRFRHREEEIVHFARVLRDFAERVSVWRTLQLGIRDRLVECAQNGGKPFFFGRPPHDYMLSARSMIGRTICAHVDGAGGHDVHRVGSGRSAISV